ncbi:hypothetical protein B0T18DRAFT_329101 [Schizothecium vesticola]|uniref:Zn(2)-C6 fungal-type domain-containing protein n=1 Tax=Schizothecium vesticola TaxID=314040 RepID=A0AA40ER41_9PEZI|nr:hypothetical protein B0T18DRAFT_329101 [Schizothecium vesticola]
MEWPSSYIADAKQALPRNQLPPQGLDGFIFDHAGPELASSSDPSFSFPAQFHHPPTSNLSTEGPLTSNSGQLLTFYGCQPLNADGFAWPENDDSAFDAATAAALLSAQFSPSPAPAPRTQRSVSASSSDSPSNSPACAAPTNLDRSHEAPSPPLEVIQWQFNNSGSTSRKRSALDDGTTASTVSRTLKKVDFQNKNGKFEGTMMTLGNPQHRRARFTAQQKAETRLARTKGGVCTRCQELKRKCDLATKGSEYEPCTRCCGTTRVKAISTAPCFRSILRDILFFREGPAANEPLFTVRFKELSIVDISNLNTPDRNLSLTQRIGNHVLTVYAAEFTPLPGDKVELHWKDTKGNRQTTKMPAFCLTNIPKVTAQIQQYIHLAKREYLESLKKDDPLVSRTVMMAMDYAKARPSSIPAMALDLWAISRMIEIEWEMCGRPGEDTLGVERISDQTNPRKGKIPIPPMMDTQLDQVVISEVLEPLKKKLLESFEAKIALNLPEDWFEIYLSSFIILNHIERLAKHSAFHARLHAMGTRFSNTPFLERAFHAAKVILSRFHFVCKGSVPLLLDWDSPTTRSLAKLDTAQLNFMKETQALIKTKGNDVSTLRSTYSYGNSLYWSSQLFDENWDNTPARVIELPRVMEAA